MPGYLTIDRTRTVCASEIIAILHVNGKKNKSRVVTGAGPVATTTKASTLIKRLKKAK